MVYKAFDNNLVSGDTLKAFKVVGKLLKRNANARDKVLTVDEFDSLLKNASTHIKGILATGYYSGMRRREVLMLTHKKINLKKRMISLEAEDTKDGKPRKIPICEDLLNVLKGIPHSIHDDHVFLFKGKPIGDLRGALRKACEKANIPYGRFVKDGFIFHDLRRSFNTNMRKAGVQESVIMAITGHSRANRAMFDRYNVIDEGDLLKAIDQLQGFIWKERSCGEEGKAETG